MIKVSIKQPERISCSINKQTIPPVTAPLDITPTEQEQTFSPSGTVTGYTPVTVGAISATELSVIANGDYTPEENEYYKKVTVNVPGPTGTINITTNGTHDVTNYAMAEVNVTAEEVYFTSDGKAYTKNMVMPSTVTSVSARQYLNCNELLTMDMSATQITNLYLNQVFSGCRKLQSIILPLNAAGTIGTSFFEYCSSLETITIPQGITTLYQSVFQGCTNLNTVVLPNGFTAFGFLVFYNCTSLETIHLPSTVVSVPTGTSNGVFRGCTNLKNVTLGDGFLANINLSASTRFTADDMVNMFNSLGTVPEGETRTFTLGATNLAKLTAEQKAIATDKGWTLSEGGVIVVRERVIPETNIREIIDDENNVVELHSESYPEDIIGIRRIHDNVKFGCVVCENLDNYVSEDYEEYEIPEETEEETNVPEYN